MEELKKLYKEATGLDVAEVVAIPGAGSNRKYYRLKGTDGSTLIGAVGTSRDENHAFCYLAKHFTEAGLPVPQVIAESKDGLRYLQSDLGNQSLFDALRGGREAGGRYNAHEKELLKRTIAALPAMQIRGALGLDFTQCYPQEALDETNVLFDLNYFKYCFLKATGLDFHELKLEASFQLMARDIVNIPGGAFMYRDFQARNVMLDSQENPYFIDFQGGRRGPVQYDVASFLWQASARYPKMLRQELIKVYLQNLKHYQEVSEKQFRQGLQLCILFRLLQVLGAYGFRGYFERKKHFLESIPPAMESLRDLLQDGGCPYPYLNEVLTNLVSMPQFRQENKESAKRSDGFKTTELNPYITHPQDGPATFSRYDAQGPLAVRVYSFSYKKGIPEDTSGNGGGYVFDCRSTHNPGRYEPYKQLTGLDEPVIRFLEDDGEILTFLESVYKLADAHVRRYIQRGFTSLMFCFGCTGGQHRSVYSAQHLAEHIHKKFGIEVHICHREQGIEQVLSPARCMVFAAGLGTRLKPLTDTMPKALVPVSGKPLLEHLLDRLKTSGFNDVVINVHHFADMIEEWCQAHPMGMHIWFSDERDQLLETGGGIKHAAPLLRDAQDGFLIHNVDILSNADLRALAEAGKGRAATLLVSERNTQRYLLFDDDMRLVGWTNIATGEVRSPYPNLDPKLYKKLAFAGVHYMSPKLFQYFDTFPERFSIIDFYLKVCDKEPIYGYVQDGLRLLDVGKLDTLKEAEEFVKA
ncbi:MAG: NTP transferase domain-containing protein [Bacteroidaceae bacterium]|nr:NTP transferase domain-containing protein [Bacteroidaceae bacterium]